MKRFPRETLSARADRLSPAAVIIKPDGDGPFPVGIMHHGCGNADGPQIHYAKAAARAGIASVIVDSYGPRRLSLTQARTLVCGGLHLWGRERAGDLLAMLHWVRQQAWADPSRLAAAGWSHGGWTIMDALALGPACAEHARLTDVPANPLDGLKTVFLVYPWCGFGAQTHKKGWTRAISAHMILGQKDSVSGVRFPLRAAAAARLSGAQVETDIYPNATHSFDEVTSVNPTFRHDPALEARAIAAFTAWMQRELQVAPTKAHADS